MIDLPMISIIIPTRNRARTLKRGLDRILAADYPALEVIVMDGGSTDQTVELLKSYGPRITKWVSEPDGGEYAALNKGILWSTGDYILHFTDDDVLIPSALEAIGAFAAQNGEYDVIFSQVNLWKEIDGIATQYGVTNYLDPKALAPDRYFRTTAGPPTQGAFVHRRLHDRIGLYAVDYVISDYEFWARSVKSGARCALLPTVVADYHYTGENQVLTRAKQIRRDHVRIASTYGTSIDRWRIQLTQALIGAATDTCHAFRLHPLQWWCNVKAKRLRAKK